MGQLGRSGVGGIYLAKLLDSTRSSMGMLRNERGGKSHAYFCGQNTNVGGFQPCGVSTGNYSCLRSLSGTDRGPRREKFLNKVKDAKRGEEDAEIAPEARSSWL